MIIAHYLQLYIRKPGIPLQFLMWVHPQVACREYLDRRYMRGKKARNKPSPF